MKKFLLSCLSLIAFGMMANAEVIELNANDATDIVGEYTAEKPAEGSSSGEAAKYQPLQSLNLGTFAFAFDKASGSTEPAYYYAMSTNENQQCNIRVYKNNVMTITAPEGAAITAISATGTKVSDDLLTPCLSGLNTGTVTLTNTSGQNMRFNTITITYEGNIGDVKKAAELVWSETSVEVENVADFVSPTLTAATNAPITFSSDNEEVATVNAEGIISLTGVEGTAIITASAEENDEYYAGSATVKVGLVSYNTYVPATSFKAGESYLIVAKRDNCTYYAYPLGETKSYGYLSTGKIEGDVNEIKVKTTYDDSFKFEARADGSYNIADCYGRYLIQQGTYNSFNLLTEAPEAGWTVESNGDDTFEISMNGYTWMFGQGTYTSFGIYNEPQENVAFPQLYVKGESSIVAVADDAANANAPVVYYNLQGVRVQNPANGIYVRVQGNNATKVLVK